MVKILTVIIDEISDFFGYTSAIDSIISSKPTMTEAFFEPDQVVDITKVIAWEKCSDHRINARRNLFYRRKTDTLSFHAKDKMDERYDICNLVLIEETERWKCDLSDINGLLASKSDLSQYKSLDDFALNGKTRVFEVISESNLRKLLQHKEIRIIHDPNTSDHFVIHQWDGRLFLNNEGGSHHLATAHFIAKKLNIKVTLTGKLTYYKFNYSYIDELLNEYELFLQSREDIFGGFDLAMKSYGAPFHVLPLPKQLAPKSLLLLPKTNRKSKNVASLLRQRGTYDFSQYFRKYTVKPMNHNKSRDTFHRSFQYKK